MPQGNEHHGRVAVITGGSGGIGGAIARRLHDEGAIVHVLDLKPAHASEWSFHTVDVANEAEVDTTLNVIGKTARNIDYLVCCAGIYRPRPFLELSYEDWQRTLQINLTGDFLCCRAALRFMRPRKFGGIVLFSSMAARTGGVNVAHYAASKGGILGLARSLAVESAAENIRVNTISPVITDTPMPVLYSPMKSWSRENPESRWVASSDVEDMTEACMFLLSDDSSYIVGQDVRVNGGSNLW